MRHRINVQEMMINVEKKKSKKSEIKEIKK